MQCGVVSNIAAHHNKVLLVFKNAPDFVI
jgi:hypothetical protein